MGVLDGIAEDLVTALDARLDGHRAELRSEEIGTVTRVSAGVAEVEGFTELFADELILFPGGLMGAASEIEERRAGVILFGPAEQLPVGAEARRTGRVIDVPVGEALLGRIVDGLGAPLDGEGRLRPAERWPVERPAPAILDRAPVELPLQTGVKAVDAAIPIGRGQRELVIGDRQTGKTAIALSAILSHAAGRPGTEGPLAAPGVCVYCAIGQRAASVARVIETLRREGALERTVVVIAGSEDAPGLQFVAPYAATSIAEWFMARGDDVLVVFDDLTRHARAYRELSLLLRRPPGREAYPGDIFYIHSRLLERATHLRDELGGGSLTALPIIETQAQNISAYIPTNLISITDGQIYLSPDLFEKGQLPAVDLGRSVSRVGAKAQLPAYRAVAGDLRLSFAQFEELEVFSRFGTRLDEETRAKLARGRRVRAALRQRESERPPPPEQIAVLLAATQGMMDDLPLERVAEAERAIAEAIRRERPELCREIERGAAFGDDDRAALAETVRAAIEGLGEGRDGDA
ncbi:F0F1 ATP synthase subunit alpha [Rhodosalinus halophilus]|uniref:ATP synthase subunit alpha n=1 Tax=Rhodosalinus halophilus TaxID=2259333 RepID=A0A365U5R2_9RHOB|nr:F0F1 ATP synthase subunit alpha [Rhodosalinus halophilus]RBI83648.1 F0F1 ATP synthase subunit alpha [Rhodosalinus halophilus]